MKQLPIEIINKILLYYYSHEHFNKFKKVLEEIIIKGVKKKVNYIIDGFIVSEYYDRGLIKYIGIITTKEERETIKNNLKKYYSKYTKKYCNDYYWCKHIICILNSKQLV